MTGPRIAPDELTVRQLIELLEDLVSEGMDEQTPVRVAYQPNYPLIATFCGVVTRDDVRNTEDGKEPDALEIEGEPNILYLLADYGVPYGDNEPYGKKVMWDLARRES